MSDLDNTYALDSMEALSRILIFDQDVVLGMVLRLGLDVAPRRCLCSLQAGFPALRRSSTRALAGVCDAFIG